VIYIVWRFTAKPVRVAEFERHYGSEGSWSQLFRRSPGYQGTTLLRDSATSNRFLLWDCWDSLSSFERFRQEHGTDYAALDNQCEALTEEETKVGIFEGL